MAVSIGSLGRLLHRKGSYDEAEGLLKKSISIFTETVPADHPYIAITNLGLSKVFLDQGRPNKAEHLLRQALEVLQKKLGETHSRTIESKLFLGICLGDLMQFDEAEPLLLEGYSFFQETHKVEFVQQARQALYDLYTAWGKPEQAATYRDLTP